MAARSDREDFAKVMRKLKITPGQIAVLKVLAQSDPWRYQFPPRQKPIIVHQNYGDLDLRDFPADCFSHVGQSWELTLFGRHVAAHFQS